MVIVHPRVSVMLAKSAHGVWGLANVLQVSAAQPILCPWRVDKQFSSLRLQEKKVLFPPAFLHTGVTTEKLAYVSGQPWHRGREGLLLQPNLTPGLLHSGIKVTALDANHCPGAVMLLFKTPEGVYLFTGLSYRVCVGGGEGGACTCACAGSAWCILAEGGPFLLWRSCCRMGGVGSRWFFHAAQAPPQVVANAHWHTGDADWRHTGGQG